MENNVNILIEKAEVRWLNWLDDHVYSAFSTKFLPSHDASHSRRVWEYGKHILTRISRNNHFIDLSLVEGLLISAYFHDLGMILTKKADHGRVSRQLCEDFFSEKDLNEPGHFEEILRAIELHDLKTNDYCEEIPLNKKPGLLSLLNISDDLDALGVIGIYRYAEIYLQRGTDIRNIGMQVLENVGARYNNFSRVCFSFPDLINAHSNRYAEIISFFDNYNQQLVIESSPETELTGPVGIVNLIRKFSIDQKIHPVDYTKFLQASGVTKFVMNFFITLKDEFAKSV